LWTKRSPMKLKLTHKIVPVVFNNMTKNQLCRVKILKKSNISRKNLCPSDYGAHCILILALKERA
jgi:hypothetical protein